MIDFYTWYTSNGRKVGIFLEEAGLEYKMHPVDIGRGEQFDPDFLKLSPNNRIPAIVDYDGPDGQPMSVFESGAILIYLAEKTGVFLPASGSGRYDVLQWLMFQMGGVGPMFGQYNHFKRYAREKIPYAINRYGRECGRLYWVMEKRLGNREYIAGDYSIADMALYPWARTFDWREQDTDEIPNVKAWVERIEARPAVQRAMAAHEKSPRPGPIDDRHWENMYGDAQYQRR
jgi:GST-like protein